MSDNLKRILSVILLTTLIWSYGIAAPLRVGVIESPPFAFKQLGVWHGLAVQAWDHLAKANKWPYTMTDESVAPQKAFADLKAKKIDVILGLYSLDKARILNADFSRPYYLNRLGVITKINTSLFWSHLANTFSTVFYLPLLILFLLIVIFALIYHWAEQKKEPMKIHQTVWLSLVILISSGLPNLPKTRTGKAIVVALLILSLGFFSTVVASLTSSLHHLFQVSSQEKAAIIEDKIKGRPIAIVDSGEKKIVAANLGGMIEVKKNYEQAFKALNQGKVSAIVGDNIVLKAELNRIPHSKNFLLTPITRNKFEVSFVFQLHSHLVKPTDVMLHSLSYRRVLHSICHQYLSKTNASHCIT